LIIFRVAQTNDTDVGTVLQRFYQSRRKRPPTSELVSSPDSVERRDCPYESRQLFARMSRSESPGTIPFPEPRSVAGTTTREPQQKYLTN
jgi:hypothetical protein